MHTHDYESIMHTHDYESIMHTHDYESIMHRNESVTIGAIHVQGCLQSNNWTCM